MMQGRARELLVNRVNRVKPAGAAHVYADYAGDEVVLLACRF